MKGRVIEKVMRGAEGKCKGGRVGESTKGGMEKKSKKGGKYSVEDKLKGRGGE